MDSHQSNISLLSKRLKNPGSKRLLALDGGGIRGLISLGYLEEIEKILRQRHKKPDLVLSDYFDLIGGTSTGAIIACCLALGWPVKRLQEMYQNLGRDAFAPRKNWFGPLGRFIGAKFADKPLEDLLKENIGDRTLDSPDLKTGLMIILKRTETSSVWVMVNIPDHRFYEMNRKIKLWELVRSSAAAPTFFKPKLISDVGEGEEAVFVDGGVSMHNNPALQLLMVANLKGFSLEWPLGEEKLLLCSVGTGGFTHLVNKEAVKKFTNLHWLAMLITQLMTDASELNQTILQWMSRSPTAKFIDRQIESLGDDFLTFPPLLSYLRYNVELEKTSLEKFGLQFNLKEIESLKKMSNVKNIPQLYNIGTTVAKKQVLDKHFPKIFDM